MIHRVVTIAMSFRANALSQARSHAFLPANAAQHYAHRLPATTLFGTGNGRVNPHRQDFHGMRHIVVQGDDQIAHVNMTQTNTPRGSAVVVSPTLARRPRRQNDPNGHGSVVVATPNDSFPSYFLPWDSRGAVVELSIPRDTGPRFFFTAVLSGCTILFCGPAHTPTVYHCGTAGLTGGGQPTTGDSNQFFLDLVRKCRIHLGLGRQDGALATDNRRVLSTDYMVKNGVNAGIALAMQNIFQNERNYFAQRGYRLEVVEPWGSVFGVRTAGNWAFYLQVNATYVYRREAEVTEWDIWWVGGTYLPLPWRMTRDTTQSNPQHAVAKPLFTQKIFPTRDGQVNGVRGTGINLA